MRVERVLHEGLRRALWVVPVAQRAPGVSIVRTDTGTTPAWDSGVLE